MKTTILTLIAITISAAMPSYAATSLRFNDAQLPGAMVLGCVIDDECI